MSWGGFLTTIINARLIQYIVGVFTGATAADKAAALKKMVNGLVDYLFGLPA